MGDMNTRSFLARSVMSLYEGAKTRVIVNSEFSKEVEVKVGMQKKYVNTFYFCSLENGSFF